MPSTLVEIVLDSVNTTRLTTFKLRYPRIIHSEVLTHRVFSRNAASSRAIPTHRLIEQVREDPFIPKVWTSNRRGMQGGPEVQAAAGSKAAWLQASRQAAKHAEILLEFDVHKQLANRLLEPFLYIDVILSGTEFENFFELRCSPMAQPEFQELAGMMRSAYRASSPVKRTKHSPFHDDPYVAAGRCARVSYANALPPDEEKDRELGKRLLSERHMSPFEHVAWAGRARGNFEYWKQMREFLEAKRDLPTE